MLERRRLSRNRVYYGGLLAFNAGYSTLGCIVRDLSASGAKIEFENTAILPHQVEFILERRAFSCAARLVWRKPDAAGLAFDVPTADSVISFALAHQQRARERMNPPIPRSEDFGPDTET